tara:strand:- start:1066 stop:1953 length:888 start_codon:yes stop_codon:yes gene_type:complete
MKKVILALLFSLVITPVFGKIVTMNGVQYQVWIDEESGEYRMKPVDSSPKDFGKPKVTKLQPTGILLNPQKKVEVIEEKKIQPIGSVLNRKSVKSDVIEKVESEASYVEQICDNPLGCKQNIKTGDCPDCKKVQIYEQKIVQKTPEKVVVHKKIQDVPLIKEGIYELRKLEIAKGTEFKQYFFSEGYTFEYKLLSRNEYYEKIGGSAVYYDGDVKKVISCPIHTIYIVKLDDNGNKIRNNRIQDGSCASKYINDISFDYDSDQNLRKIKKRLNSVCITDHCDDKGAIDILTLVKI